MRIVMLVASLLGQNCLLFRSGWQLRNLRDERRRGQCQTNYTHKDSYIDKSKAVHWDGRNKFGEPVGSSVYFYHLSAGEYSATKKMVILK